MNATTLHDLIAGLIVLALVAPIGVSVVVGRTIPPEFWTLAGVSVGYYVRSAAEVVKDARAAGSGNP